MAEKNYGYDPKAPGLELPGLSGKRNVWTIYPAVVPIDETIIPCLN